MGQSTENSRVIKAPAAKIFQAFTDPKLLMKWQVPGDMTAKIHYFNPIVGGGYQTTLYYPANEAESKGKTNPKEDKYTARFIELISDKKIVEGIRFESDDPDYDEEMIMEVNLESVANGTEVRFSFRNLPKGIDPADNEAGTKSSLEKLAKLVE